MNAQERFERFSDHLRNWVTVELLSGGKVSSSNRTECRCPLGCLPLSSSDRPTPKMASSGILTSDEASAFIAAFDGSACRSAKRLLPHYKLGLAYRKRFP